MAPFQRCPFIFSQTIKKCILKGFLYAGGWGGWLPYGRQQGMGYPGCLWLAITVARPVSYVGHIRVRVTGWFQKPRSVVVGEIVSGGIWLELWW